MPIQKAIRGLVVGILLALAAAGAAASAARADDTPACPSSTPDAYTLTAAALTGPAATDLKVRVAAAAGCDDATVVKHVQIKTFDATGDVAAVRNLHDQPLEAGAATIALPRIDRGLRIEVAGQVQTGAPTRTYVVRDATTSKLRPDLVVAAVHAPAHILVGKPFEVTVDVEEKNGDTGASAHVTLADAVAQIGDPQAVTVAAGKTTEVTFSGVTLGAAVPSELTLDVADAVPAEYDATNAARHATVDVTKSELPSPATVLFPSLLGYGAQFGMHLYAPITPWPANLGYGDVENKVKQLEPQLVRIFYNDNWDGNANGKFPDWQTNYASFVRVVQLAQAAGATIDISFQNLGNLPTTPIPTMMAKFADVLQDLVVAHGLTNVRWVEVGNEPNNGTGVSLTQYEALYRAIDAQLRTRGLRDQIKLMGGGLVENTSAAGVTGRTHYDWLPWIATHMGDVVDAYAEHVYWRYSDTGRLEYRLRDIYHLENDTDLIPLVDQKPMYMMEYGIRGDATCGTKPTFQNLYYSADASCPEIWRTNIAGFQQLWFNVDASQLGMAGTSKWDAFWSRYDNSSAGNQLYWMIGPPTEGSQPTPTYYALSLLSHTTAPGWKILRVDPWQDDDWSVPQYGAIGGNTSNDHPEQELVAYAGPKGELTVVGLDTRGRSLNKASTDPPSAYSIAGLPPDTQFNLDEWNATGDGTDSVAPTVTTNAAGVARFEVPLQAAFALTNVPVA